MILVLEDDATLHLYDTVEAVLSHIEALDAEDTLRAVFDEHGQRFRIEWLRPNKRGKAVLGLVEPVENGDYTLVPDGPVDSTALLELIRTSQVDPAAASTIRKLEASLKAIG
jgi:hypothetical protein